MQKVYSLLSTPRPFPFLHKHEGYDLRRRLHVLLWAACGSRSKVPHIDIFIFLQSLQVGQDPLLDELLAPRGWRSGLAGLLQVGQSPLGRQASQCIDQHSIRLGDIKSNIRNLVCGQSVHDGKNRVFNNIQGNRRSKSLELVNDRHF